jgi:hypothetical protein
MLLLPNILLGQEIQSPSEFLGYPLGNKFTYHHRVVDYFEYVDQLSDHVILEKYGQTYERRELLVAYISSPENLEKIDQIRTNNLKRTGLMEGPFDNNDVAIVWLSYNVHGNEANSTETSMRVLYELTGKNAEKHKSWLDKLIIVIDPCLNPDGRDRYVNWYNQVAGTIPNPNVNVREHHEDWAQGRSNHYLFDLNRDWVWQTQTESQRRMALYNSWMPQVHVDFHEQGYDDKYYFAPAAQPMHELITPWQKEFQAIIGKNNSKHFDEKGWLYFTRERFDLLYPGYGDTYPTYNGAIGMTYEMAGHSLAGLAIKTEKGDTLTLHDRIDRHFTTSISTIEASFENRVRLLQEFNNFFKPRGNDYYVLKSDKRDRLELLAELMEKNKIFFETPSEKVTVKALAHENNQLVTLNVAPGDLVVPLNQPKSALAKILFEKNTKLVDTLTYDITAWSLPYVYGVEGYHASGKISLSPFQKSKAESQDNETIPYAYLLSWSSMKDAEFLSRVLQLDIKVNYFTQSFSYAGQKFSEGTLVINRIDNVHIPDLQKNLNGIAMELNRKLVPLYSGAAISTIDLGSAKISFLKNPKIALLAGNGISTLDFGELWYFFEQEMKMPVDILNAASALTIELDDYDVLILASGRYENLTGEEGFKKLDEWVKKGGKLILLENAITGFIGENKFALKKPEKDKDKEEKVDPVMYPYADNERETLKKYIQGGIIRMEIDPTHPLAYGYEDHYYTLKNNSSSYNYLQDGWNVGYITSENKTVAGFVGSETKEKLNKNLVFGVEERGRGKVVYFADDPMFRSFWQNGKLFMANAVFFDN